MDCDFTHLVFLSIEERRSNLMYAVVLFVLTILELYIYMYIRYMYVCMYVHKEAIICNIQLQFKLFKVL